MTNDAIAPTCCIASCNDFAKGYAYDDGETMNATALRLRVKDGPLTGHGYNDELAAFAYCLIKLFFLNGRARIRKGDMNVGIRIVQIQVSLKASRTRR